jgi:2',3'-cyclic-nucleotide 2'-phosphodiesterase (5'-nucleotidase family)
MVATLLPVAAFARPTVPTETEITILHTNDFHGRLEADYKDRGGSANLAGIIDSIKKEVGKRHMVLLDAGDAYFAAPAVSQLLMGESTIDVYNEMGYDLAVFGNHEFDKGQVELAERVAQSEFPWLGANVVLEGTAWDLPGWAEPYEILTVGQRRDRVKLGVLGLAGEETPEVTLIGTTAGIVFKDLTETILHYYDEVMAQADAMIVVVHMGTENSGPYDGLETVAQALIDAGKPVDLMIGGHQHQALYEPIMVGNTAIVSAGYYGRYLGELKVSINPATKKLTVQDYYLHTVTGHDSKLAALVDTIETFHADGMIPRQVVVNQLVRRLERALKYVEAGRDVRADFQMRIFMNIVKAKTPRFIDPAAAGELLAAAEHLRFTLPVSKIADRVAYWAEVVAPIVDQPVALSNIDMTRDYNDESVVGDIVTDSMLWSADKYDDGTLNGSVDIALTNPGGLRADIVAPPGATLPYTITWGASFDVLPFGNTLYLMDLTGAQIQDLFDQSAKLYKGILQTAGASYYWYNDTGTDAPTTWGAYDVEVGGEPLVRDEVYRVVTNDFLAGGQDGWTTFAEGTNRWNTYFDMQAGFVDYLEMLGTVDAEDIEMGRIIELDSVVTILHTNDTHGRWPAQEYRGAPNGMELLASLVAEQRAKNPNALLLDAGDTFQGNSFAYFFKDRPDNPIAGGMNLMEYDAMVVGNHEFNFGPTTFATMLSQVEFPLLGTLNMNDTGAYGFINDNVEDYITLDVDGKKVVITGFTNSRIYRYELPTNIPGMSFLLGYELAPTIVSDVLAAEDPDLMVGLNHLGFDPYGDEVDSDELIAETVAGYDVIIGGHSHTRLDHPVLVTSAANPEGTLVSQAYKYAQYLGVTNIGFIGDEVVTRSGYLMHAKEATPDPTMTAFLASYIAEIDTYNDTVIGSTEVPIDALTAYTGETNGANLQADAAVWELDDKSGVPVDMHLSGAMSNRIVAEGATPTEPVAITKGDMFNLMPYENSLVVLEMTGAEIKEILERGYRNYWYYTYEDDFGGYSHYTTCVLATNEGNVITFDDGGATVPPDGDDVVSLFIDGVEVDLTSDTDTYVVSTVNYVAAGSCNFNNDGETIWPLDQITHDTQLYVRDSVINYVEAQVGPISPMIEGRLVFQ